MVPVGPQVQVTEEALDAAGIPAEIRQQRSPCVNREKKVINQYEAI
jgi:hypothetical protein